MSNRDWVGRSLAAVWHPCTQMQRHERFPLVPLARGEGAWLFDYDGRRYLDAVSSWWVNLFGHCQPKIVAAVNEQLGRLEHAMLAGFAHAPAVELAERLSARCEGRLGHAFFASDGASATEIALKMAFHYWRNRGHEGKHRYVSLAGSYHGETLGALSVTDVALFRDQYAPLLRPGMQVPVPDPRYALLGETAEAQTARCLRTLEELFARDHAEIAALIVEPLVQGAGGMAMYSPAYLSGARSLCDRFDVLLIADEIAVGFGRTGSFYACQQAGIWPDLMLLSKGITGGFLPLSVVLATDDIFRAFYDTDVARGFLHSHSYSGNPLACRAALATLDLFAERDVLADNARIGTHIDERARALRARADVRHFRRCGMIWAFEVDSAGPDFAQRLFAAALEQSLLLRPMANTVYWMPPYVLSEADADHMVDATCRALDRVASP